MKYNQAINKGSKIMIGEKNEVSVRYNTLIEKLSRTRQFTNLLHDLEGEMNEAVKDGELDEIVRIKVSKCIDSISGLYLVPSVRQDDDNNGTLESEVI